MGHVGIKQLQRQRQRHLCSSSGGSESGLASAIIRAALPLALAHGRAMYLCRAAAPTHGAWRLLQLLAVFKRTWLLARLVMWSRHVVRRPAVTRRP